MDDDDALRLFSLKAFNKDHPVKNYLEMSKHFVNYAKGLPLAIDVLGSLFYNRRKEEWESVFDRLKKFPEKDIMKIHQISLGKLHFTTLNYPLDYTLHPKLSHLSRFAPRCYFYCYI